MKLRRLVLLVTLAATLGACGAGRALRLGDTYAADGHWVLAAAAYEEAATKRPDDPALAEKLTQARDKAVAQLVAKAQRERDRQEMEAALSNLVAAEEILPGDARIAEARDDLAVLWVKAAVATTRRGELERAYELAAGFDHHFPSHPDSGPTLTAVRQAHLQASRRAESQGRWTEARGLLQSIATHEPTRPEAQEWLLDLDTRWASALEGQAARDQRARRWASAWVELALAAHLTGHSADARARDLAWEQLLFHRGVVVGPSFRGGPRADRLAQRLGESLAGLGVRWQPGASHPDLGGTMSLSAPQCVDHVATHPGMHEYVSGYDTQVNPEWAQRLHHLEGVQAELHRLLDREVELMDALDRSLHGLEGARHDLGPRQRRLDQAAAVLADVKLEVAQALDRLEEAMAARRHLERRAELKALIESTEPGPVLDELKAEYEALGEADHLTRELAKQVEVRAELLEAARVDETRAASMLAAREADVVEVQERIQRMEERVAQLEGELRDTRHAQSRIEHELSSAELALREVPKWVDVPRVDVHHFEIRDVTRTCAAELDDGTVRFTATASTRDTAWRAAPEVGLQADPLAFPRSDAQLIDQVDAMLVQQAADSLRLKVEARYQQLLSPADPDPEAALGDLLVAWSMRPASMPPGLMQQVEELVGTADRSWLRVP